MDEYRGSAKSNIEVPSIATNLSRAYDTTKRIEDLVSSMDVAIFGPHPPNAASDDIEKNGLFGTMPLSTSLAERLSILHTRLEKIVRSL